MYLLYSAVERMADDYCRICNMDEALVLRTKRDGKSISFSKGIAYCILPMLFVPWLSLERRIGSSNFLHIFKIFLQLVGPFTR